MKNITIDDFVQMREEKRKNYFFHLCLLPESSLEIKKLFLLLKSKQLFDQELLKAGLIGAIINNQEQHINTLMSFVEKNNITFDEYKVNSLFNCSFEYKNEKLINYFDEKYNVLKSLKKPENTVAKFQSSILSTGKVQLTFGVGESLESDDALNNYEMVSSKFGGDPLSFAIKSLNGKLLDFIVNKKEHIINPNLMEYLIIDLISKGKTESLSIFLGNETIRAEVLKSSELNLFLNEKTQFYEMKKEAKSIINMFALENSIDNKDDIKIKKLKL